MLEATAECEASIMSPATPGGMGGWIMTCTWPGNILFSCLLGMMSPVPSSVMGTTGTCTEADVRMQGFRVQGLGLALALHTGLRI